MSPEPVQQQFVASSSRSRSSATINLNQHDVSVLCGPLERSPEPSSPVVSEGSVTLFFSKLRSGDRSAVPELWKRFFPRIWALARKTLGGRNQRAADADDAAQSAFASFWRRAERGDFPAMDRDKLWRLLAVITVRKAKKQTQRELTQKRGGGRVVGGDPLDLRDASQTSVERSLGQLSTHEFDLYCDELLSQLSDELRQIAMLRLTGHTQEEIADLLHCTTRRIQRKLQLIRLQWEHALRD